MWRGNYCHLLSIVGIAVAPAAAVAGPAWPAGAYSYVVLDQDLRDVLQQFGVNTGLRLSLSDKVQGHVHGPLPSAPPRQFLDDLTQQFGLEWVYDGSIISVSSVGESQTQMLPLGGVPFEKLRGGLDKAGLLDARYQFRPVMDGRTALVSGPPRYIAIVRDGLAAIAAEKPPTPKAVAAPLPSPPVAPTRDVKVMRGGTTSVTEFK